ncbi:MAG: CotH kinase family protein [Verrucomicrobia bacterium]|nr:CotH kinase family protein [Verrucomicrobiota bacterium]
MRLAETLAHIAGQLRQGKFAGSLAMPRGVLSQLFLITLLSVAIAGCNRQSDVPTQSRKAQLENRQGELPVRSLAPAVAPPNPDPVAIPQGAAANAQKVPGNKLPLYELKMDPKDVAALERNPDSGETHPATFIADGEVYPNVQVRFRGEWARSWPKKPLKIFFSRAKPFQGHHSLNLNSAWRDAAFVRETLAYHVYAACGVPASRSRMVRLYLNGQFRGLYAEVEQVDKPLLKRFNLKGASLFKAMSDEDQADERDHGSEAAFARHYSNESQKTNGLHELQLFCHELALAPNTLDFFTRQVDLEKYINYLAATVLIQHWDCFNKNHFLIHDRSGSGKWLALPWDLDRTFGDHWNQSFDSANLSILLGTRRAPGPTGWNRLQDRFFSEPTLRARFLDRLAELLEKEFTTQKLFPVLDRLETAMGPDAALDRRRWPGPAGDLHNGIAGVKSYIERRRVFLQRELTQLRQAKSVP